MLNGGWRCDLVEVVVIDESSEEPAPERGSGTVATDLVVVSDHLDALDRDQLLEIAGTAVQGAALCRLSALEAVAEDAPAETLDRTLAADVQARLVSRVPPRPLSRTLDILAGVGALAAAWPVMLLIALAIRRDRRGPAVIGEVYPGKGGQPFRQLRFRTGAGNGPSAELGGARQPWSATLGRFLRRSGFDHLPHLLNLIRGDMTLVGPQPLPIGVAGALAERVPFHPVRLLERPGLTGLAQIWCDPSCSEAERLAADVEYVRRCSLWLDLYILAMTPAMLIRRVMSEPTGQSCGGRQRGTARAR